MARVDAPDSLVAAALAAVHEESLRLAIPTLIPRQDASSRVVEFPGVIRHEIPHLSGREEYPTA